MGVGSDGEPFSVTESVSSNHICSPPSSRSLQVESEQGMASPKTTPSRRARRSPNEGAPPPPGGPPTPAPNSPDAASHERPWTGPAVAHRMSSGDLRRAPLLILPERTGSTWRTLYDLSRGRGVDVDLPEMSHNFCYAAAHGWVMVGNFLTQECFLLNPLSRGDRRPLPPLSICTRNLHAALSAAPTDAACVVALAFDNTVLVCRPGDEKWSLHPLEDYEHDNWLGDCVFCGGKLFLMCSGGRSVFLLDTAGGYEEPTVERIEMDVAQLPRPPECGRLINFLVESLGEVLLVVALERSLTCRVFRADLERKAWAAVQSLGDRALFVGRGCSVSAAARGVGGGGVRADRIYISYPLLMVNRGNQRWAEVNGRWFWAEYVMALGCAPLKRTPPLRHRDVDWDASYWLIPDSVSCSTPAGQLRAH